MENTHFPKELQPYQDIIEATKKTYIKIQAKKEKTTTFQSKFGGYPYLPKKQEHPLDEEGHPMFLLAQLNFEEIPRLEGYPKTGILQFFVSPTDELVGLDFDDYTNQQNFRVVYHEQIFHDENELVTDFSYLEDTDGEYLPFQDECALTFTPQEEVIPHSDYRYNQTYEGKIDLETEVNGTELYEIYADYFTSYGHKIGGYPYFTQMDPRDFEGSYQQHTTLLLQIDSDQTNDIMWGDVGVANFFITPEDLKNRNFSNVLYTWDCC